MVHTSTKADMLILYILSIKKEQMKLVFVLSTVTSDDLARINRLYRSNVIKKIPATFKKKYLAAFKK